MPNYKDSLFLLDISPFHICFLFQMILHLSFTLHHIKCFHSTVIWTNPKSHYSPINVQPVEFSRLLSFFQYTLPVWRQDLWRKLSRSFILLRSAFLRNKRRVHRDTRSRQFKKSSFSKKLWFFKLSVFFKQILKIKKEKLQFFKST